MSDVLIGLACEDEGHFTTVTQLVDSRLISAHFWLDGILEACRTWRGLRPEERWYKYDPADAHDLRPIAIEGQQIRPQGLIRGEPLKPEASMWRKILLLFCHMQPRPDVVVLARDLDGYPERRGGMEQVRDGIPWPFPVVIAAPQPEIEAWLVAGFVPQDDQEKARRQELRRALSFDPISSSERLTSHPNDARTDAKRVLTVLLDGDSARRVACLADHERLRAVGQHNGLVSFLDAVDQRIVPLFGSPAP